MAAGNELLKLLQAAVQNRVSDVHFRTGYPPGFRTRDGVVNVDFPAFSEKDMQDLCGAIISDEAVKKNLAALQDYDGSFAVKNLARFRFNIFRNQGQLGAVLRIIQEKIPSIADLGLPSSLSKIAELNRGLVLVTGTTGSGKSSTLAALINHINETQHCHILTIEDPVEFVHVPKKSRITQREVGRDTENFASALRSALRQDPDVILVGEMRDIETLDIALKASETGHLVFSTVHTTDARKTIARLVALYPPESQLMARLRLAENLEATISQRMVSCADGKSRTVAMEIMRANLAIRECIADPQKTGDMNTYIENAYETMGSQTFDMHLARLVKQGVISFATASEAASNAADFERNITFGDAQDGAIKIPGQENNKLSLENYDDAVTAATTAATPNPAPTPPTPLRAPPTPMATPSTTTGAVPKTKIPTIPKIPA